MDKYRNGYALYQQRHQYDCAYDKHNDNKWAITNHLIKHYGYTQNDAWEIYEEGSGYNRDGSRHILAKDKPKVVVTDENYYIVADHNGNIVLTGDEAKAFLKAADKLKLGRDQYRVFIEVGT
jgi:hypothetical protein